MTTIQDGGRTMLLESSNWVLDKLSEEAMMTPAESSPDCYFMYQDNESGVLTAKKGADGIVLRKDQNPAFRLTFHCGCSEIADTDSSASSETTMVGTKLLFCDERVNIWEFRLAPGARCEYHSHKRPYFFLNLTESWTQELGRQGNHVGEPRFQCVLQTTHVKEQHHLGSHGVRNIGKEPFLQFVVEFKEMIQSNTPN
jgi:hypothetical protein